MPTVIFLGEIAILAAVLCGMHALKPRFGPAPFYMLLGLLEVFLFVSGKGEHKISVQMFYSVTHISTPLCLSLILTGLEI